MTVILDYADFIDGKVDLAEQTGFELDDFEFHPSGKGHQNLIIRRALRDGKILVAAAFGLGKTQIGLEAVRAVHEKTGKKVLFVAQLGVRHQFVNRDGPRLGMTLEYCRTDQEIIDSDADYIITNYERIRDGENIHPQIHDFGAVIFDEGNIMRSLASVTYDVFKKCFADVPIQIILTATPAPNDYREIIYYANFLDVMDNGQSLTRWFGRNPDKAGDLKLLPQFEREFWLWVSTWAVFLNKPSDLGFDDEGYNTPGIKVHWHRLPVDYSIAWKQVDSRGQARLIPQGSVSAADMSKNKHNSMQDRLDKAKQIIDETDDNVLLWHLFEYERGEIEKQIPGALTVYGSQSPDEKEAGIMAFEDGKVPILATKASIAGSGCNFQAHCHTNVFMSLNYSFNDLIQAIKRTDRFQQEHVVDVHFIYDESEDGIVASLKRKWAQYDALNLRMSRIIRKYGLNHKDICGALKRVVGVQRQVEEGKLFTLVLNDSVYEMEHIEDNSIDYMLTSIPFGNHYEYTTQVEDMGHNSTDNDFWEQMGYLIPLLYNKLKPGRKIDIHVKDRVLYGHQTPHGFTEISNFLGETKRELKKWGFIDCGHRTIVTDVVRENNSTYRLGWSECCKDSTKMGSGLPEYVVTFRKPPSNSEQQYADERVVHHKPGEIGAHCPHCGWWGPRYEDLEVKVKIVYNIYQVQEEQEVGRKCPVCSETVHRVRGNQYSKARWQLDAHSFWRSDGDSGISQELYNYWEHLKEAEIDDEAGRLPSTFMKYPPQSPSPFVWTDVNFMHGLQSKQVARRVRKHICPLPFDIVQRMIYLNSNPGDLVLDPFAGLGTVPYVAVKLGRRGYGIEINPASFNDSVKYLRDIEREKMMPTLFDFAFGEEEKNE